MLEKYKLENGATVLLDHVDGVRSASIGLWFRAGSRDETPQEAGAAHFIEHMLFKGTASLSSAELAGRMDDIGGQRLHLARLHQLLYARAGQAHA